MKNARNKDKEPWKDQVKSVDKSWPSSILLSKTGLFPMEDVAEMLSIRTSTIKSHGDRIEKQGRDVKKIVGIHRANGHWFLDMEVFCQYYYANLLRRVRRVEKHWNANTMLSQNGIFLLTDVCSLIPLTAGQIRYQAKKTENSREKLGVWKDEEEGSYLVDMAIFGPWITMLWNDHKP